MKITIEVEFKDHRYVVLTRSNGDTYTSSSDALMDFLHARDQPEVKNLAQPDVSGNEANPEIKQSGEVAVCEECLGEGEINIGGKDIHCKKCNGSGKQTDR